MAFVRDSAGTGSSSGYQSSVSCPSGAAVGDLLIVCHMVDNDISGVAAMSAVSTGFVEIAAYTNNYVPRLKMWAKQLNSGDLGSSFTFRHNTDTNNDRSWSLIALSCGDVDPDTPLIGMQTYYRPNGSTQLTANSVPTGSNNNTLSVVMGCGLRYGTSDPGAQFFNPPANWVERYDVGQVWMKPTVYTRDNISGTQTGSAFATILNSGANNGQSVIHAALRHKTYVPPAPAGPEPGRWFQMF